MADLVQIPGSVVANRTGLQQQQGVLGQSVNQGMPLYLNNDDGNFYQASAGLNVNAAGNFGLRLALTGGAANQPVTLFISGQINLGATLSAGETYCISTNTGRVCKFSEVNTGNFTTILGTALNTTYIQTPSGGAFASGVVRP